MPQLTDQLHEEHDKLMPHIDALRILADDAPRLDPADLRARMLGEHAFLVRDFVPHMDAEQETLYPAMEQVLRASRSNARMSHAHGEIRGLIDAVGALGDAAGASGVAWLLEVRRALYELFALLKVHLAEEELLTPILEGQLTEAEEVELAAHLEFGVPPAPPPKG
jgi:hemerythrin-like domain-containing protein